MDVYEEIVRLRNEGRRAALATIVTARGSIPSRESAKMLVRDDGTICGSIGGGCVEADVIFAARKVMDTEIPELLEFNLHKNPNYDMGMICGGSLDVYLEPILPQPTLYIFGGGHVGFNVYRIALLAGFRVVIVDDRPAFAGRERFPDADGLVCDNDWEAMLAQVAPSDSAFILIVTRGHREDARVLRWAVGTPARYIGMIGSRRKVATVHKALLAEGIPPEKFDRVHAPVGLDIGAVTPEEIAISTVAEMIALRRQSAAALPFMRFIKSVPADERTESQVTVQPETVA